MTRTEALALLNSLPRMTFVDFTFKDFDGEIKRGYVQVEHQAAKPATLFLIGNFGHGKTHEDLRAALKDYLGGRELISHQHHN